MKTNKKGIMVEALVIIIITSIMAVSILISVKSCFRLTSQAEQSFNKLVELIERVYREGGTESMRLIMDRKTALIGFTSDADKVVHQDLLNTKNHYLDRPTSCESNKACLCLCTSISRGSDEPSLDEERYWNYEYECKKIKCNSFKSIDFLNSIDEDDFGSYPSGIDPLKSGNYYRLLNGFIHTRKGPDTFPGIPTRNNQIYVENHKNIISVCFKSSCISEEMKNERISITIGEFEEVKFMFTPGWVIGVDTNNNDELETFYYIEDIVKDNFGNYYYKYKFGIKPENYPEQAAFLETIQEKTKQDFESKIINYAKQGKLVEIDYNNEEANINSFKAETKMDEQGNVINVGGVTGSW